MIGQSVPFVEKLSLGQSFISNSSPLPTSKQESWKYFSPEEILEKSFPLASSSHCPQELNPLADESVVFVNGKIDEQRSSLKKITIKKQKSQAAIAKEFFCEVNSYLCKEDICINIPAKFSGSVHIIHIHNEDKAFIPNSIKIDIGEHAQCFLIQEFRGFSSSYFSHSALKINICRFSVVNFVYLQDNSLSAYHLSYVDVDQDESSCLNSYSIQWGGKKTRQNFLVKLNGEKAEAYSYGLYLAGKSQTIDNNTQLNHLIKETNSKQHYKGIIANFGRAIFNGKIYVAPHAQKIDSSQLNNNLLLGSKARVDTKPEIDVFADDIVCGHGATIGNFDEKQLFYLLTRCINKEDAQVMLLSAFVEEITFKIQYKPLLDHLQKKLYSHLSVLEIESD